MQIGIFAKTFERPTLEENLDAVAAHGVRTVQYNLACAGIASLPAAIPAGLPGRIRRAAAARGVALAALSGTFNIIHPDPARVRDGMRRFRLLAASCREMGVDLMTLCTGTRDERDMWTEHPANHGPEAWSAMRAAVAELLGIAGDYDLTLAIEPETANVVDSPAKARRLIDELRTERLKVVLDPANLYRAQDIPRMRAILDRAFELVGGDIRLAHAKDLRIEGGVVRHVAAGDGILDYPYYLSLLHRVDAPLIAHGLDERQAPASLAFLRERAARAEVTAGAAGA
jgi:sugar phosphate isomerase/epimerase